MVVLSILFVALTFVLFPSNGQITSPPDGTNMTVLPGSTVTISWSFADKISGLIIRAWYFTSSDGSMVYDLLARIIADGIPDIYTSGLPGVSIIKPATLVLKNVNQTYNGTYQFYLSGVDSARSSQVNVVVFIAKKPNVTVNCSSFLTLNEDDDVTCLCKGENGNPPAEVIWYDKNGDPIGQKEKESKALVLRNVTETDSGTYACKAQSYTLVDEKSIEVIVYYKPTQTDIEFSSNPARIGEDLMITCSSKSQPKAFFTIIHNGTIYITGNGETHTIRNVNWNAAGYYTCVASNILGRNPSNSKFLNVKAQKTLPPTGSNNIFLPGETVTIKWSFNDAASKVLLRAWYFTSSDGSFVNKLLACIIRDGQPQVFSSGLSGLSILKPATLLLKNVNKTYNGTYRFLRIGPVCSMSKVFVFIARRPTVTINCSTSVTLDEGQDLTCLCKGENGNPPAVVMWYNEDPMIGQKEKENKALVLRNVTKTDIGTYTCKAQSYTLVDEKSIKVKVNPSSV